MSLSATLITPLVRSNPPDTTLCTTSVYRASKSFAAVDVGIGLVVCSGPQSVPVHFHQPRGPVPPACACCQISPLTKASSVTPAVEPAGLPFCKTCPELLIDQ